MKTRLRYPSPSRVSRLALMFMLLMGVFSLSSAQEVESRRPASLRLLGEPVFDQALRRVSLEFIVREGNNGLNVPDLNTANFSLSEPANNLVITSEERLDLTLAVIVDLSFGADDDIIRSTLRAFFDTYYQTEDDVTLYILDGENSQNFRVVPINSVDQAREVIEGLRRSRRFYSVEPAFSQALSDLESKDLPPEAPRYGIYVGSYLNVPSETVTADNYRNAGIPLHVIQAHRFRQSATTPLRRLANTGGGLFAENRDDTYVLPGSEFLPVNPLKVLYDAINGTRLIYTLSYEPGISLEANRAVTLTARFLTGEVLTADFNYTWTFQPPQITFVDAQQLRVERKTFRPDQSSPAEFLVDEQTVTIQVTFPDGVQRSIRNLSWEVNDENADSLLRYEVQAPQLDAQNRTSFTWSLLPYTTFGETKPITMVVSITDELGYTNQAQEQGEVRIQPEPTLIPTATFTPTATHTPTPTLTPTPTPPPPVVALGGVEVEPMAGNVQVTAPSSTLLALAGALGLLLLVAVFLAWRNARRVRREQRRRRELEHQLEQARANQPVAPDSNAPAQAPKAPTVQNNAPKPFAKLVIGELTERDIIERSILQQTFIPITKPQFYIGRDAARADLVINADYISPLHCKIEIRGTTYRVTDLSKNGTYVEGNPIYEPTTVPNKGQIWITPKVKLVIYSPDEQIQATDDQIGMSTVHRSTRKGEDVQFELPPGVSDTTSSEARPIPRDYSP